MKKLAILLFLSIIFTGCYPYISDNTTQPKFQYLEKHEYNIDSLYRYDPMYDVTNTKNHKFIQNYKYNQIIVLSQFKNYNMTTADTIVFAMLFNKCDYYKKTVTDKKPKYYNTTLGTTYEYYDTTKIFPFASAKTINPDSLCIYIYSTFKTYININVNGKVFLSNISINYGDNVFYISPSIFNDSIWIQIYNNMLYYGDIVEYSEFWYR